MTYIRIVFYLEQNHDLRVEDELILFEDSIEKCKVQVDRREEKVKVFVSYGPFKERKKAEENGRILLYGLKKAFIQKRIPINISGSLGVLDSTSKSVKLASLTEHGKQNLHLIFPQLAETSKRQKY